MARAAPNNPVGQIVLAAERACSALHELADASTEQASSDDLAEALSREGEFMAQRLHAHAELLLLEAWGGTPESVRKTTRLVRQLLHSARPAVTTDPLLGDAAPFPTTTRPLADAAIHHLDALDQTGRQAITDRRPTTASIRRHGHGQHR